jgi:hypothetical protein
MSEFMIQFSSVVLFLGLQYHEMNLASGVQTFRLGWAGPVSFLHGRAALTGCFLLFCLFHPSAFSLHTSYFCSPLLSTPDCDIAFMIWFPCQCLVAGLILSYLCASQRRWRLLLVSFPLCLVLYSLEGVLLFISQRRFIARLPSDFLVDFGQGGQRSHS